MLWEDGVDQDMRILGVKNWKKVALNRDEWAKLLKKATEGCRANDNDEEVLQARVSFWPHTRLDG